MGLAEGEKDGRKKPAELDRLTHLGHLFLLYTGWTQLYNNVEKNAESLWEVDSFSFLDVY